MSGDRTDSVPGEERGADRGYARESPGWAPRSAPQRPGDRAAAAPPYGDSPGGLLDGLPEAGRGTGAAPPPARAVPEPGHRPAPPRPPAAQSAPADPARPEPRSAPADTPREETARGDGEAAQSTAHNVIPLRTTAAERPEQPSPDQRSFEAHRDAAPHDRAAARHEDPDGPADTPSTTPGAEPVGAADDTGAGPVEPAPAPAEGGPVGYAAEVVAEPAGVSAERDAEPTGGHGAPGPGGHGYSDVEREVVHRVIRERRDVRVGFRPDPVPDDVLVRILEAAHHAPSVGFSQPWDFLVIHNRGTRTRVRDVVQRQREAYTRALPGARARAFSGLKVEAILDAPLNIVVTSDPTRGGRQALHQPSESQSAAYSAALAVENLWLAARAEGLGVGWVSFFSEHELVRELDLPPHLEIVAYLCVGYVEEFPTEPELSLGDWARRRPLSRAVHHERYGQRGLPGAESTSLLEETVAEIGPLNRRAVEEAGQRQARMTKPPGSLGVLEDVSVQLAGLAGQCPAPVPEPATVAVFAADHGVHAQGVTHWPQEVTTQMVRNFLDGGAVVNAFAAQVGAEVTVVDVGVVDDLPAAPGLLSRKIARGTADMTRGPAMSRTQAEYAIEAGIEVARDLAAAGNRCLLTGDMGIANTTASAALVAVFTGREAAEVTGRGTGVDNAVYEHKIEVVRAALRANRVDPKDPVGVLAAVGGLEHAALAGFILGAASLRIPVLLDGVIAGAAALAAVALAPEARLACVAGHRSSEPGHSVALEHLELRPLVDLELRLGEGSGALLALPLVQSAARALHDVATFDSAGVSRRD